MSSALVYAEGELIEGLWEDGSWYTAKCEYETDNGYYITFTEYGTSHEYTMDRLRKVDKPSVPAPFVGAPHKNSFISKASVINTANNKPTPTPRPAPIPETAP